MKHVYLSEDSEKVQFQHYYDITEEDNIKNSSTTILNRSKESSWLKAARGEEALRLIDNGNGYEVSFEEGQKEFHLEYHEAQELFIMLLTKIDTPIKLKESKITLQWPL